MNADEIVFIDIEVTKDGKKYTTSEPLRKTEVSFTPIHWRLFLILYVVAGTFAVIISSATTLNTSATRSKPPALSAI